MKSHLIIGLLVSALAGYSQQVEKLSLSKEVIKPRILNFNIRVVDIRDVKSGVGTLQKGVTNSVRVATFDNSLEEEVTGLVYRSCGKPATTVDVALGVRLLNISEFTSNTSEYALADLTVDLFLVLNNQFYFINRKHAVYRSKAFDVTHQHESNIAYVIEQVLRQFTEVDIEDQLVSSDALDLDELQIFQPPMQEIFVSILEDQEFPDGVYMSFDEFKVNKPSVWEGYEIKEGSDLSFNWIDEKGKRIKNDQPVYAVAHNNKLYKYFSADFYPIEKRGNKLIFLGKPMTSSGNIAKAAYWGGLAGLGVNKALGHKVRMVYELDLDTGEVKERGFSN